VSLVGRTDDQALADLYDTYGSAVYGLALRITRDPGVAEEVCLDAFLRFWQDARDLGDKPDEALRWLLTIARSRSIDRLRAANAMKRRQAIDHAAPTAAPAPDDAADLLRRRDLVRQTLSRLSPTQRTPLELAYYEGLSHSEIAKRLGEPLGTVKTRIRQAMSFLRRELAPVLS
jgi:RNA polymerase sigma-70 factor (ECF subfamily)